jgi:hypothetical protein
VDPDPELFAGSGSGSGSGVNNFGSGSGQPDPAGILGGQRNSRSYLAERVKFLKVNFAVVRYQCCGSGYVLIRIQVIFPIRIPDPDHHPGKNTKIF